MNLRRVGIGFLAVGMLAASCNLVRDGRYGSLKVMVDWPEETRAIPSYAKSARVILEDVRDGYGGGYGGGQYNERTRLLTRNSANAYEEEVRFDSILRRYDEDYPYFEHFVEVLFYSGSGGTGTVVASAKYIFRFRDFNWNHDFVVAPYTQSEILSLRVDGPFNIRVQDGPRQMIGNGIDQYSRTIALPARALRWQLVSGDAATVTEDGLLTPIKVGTIQVRLFEVDNAVDPVLTTISITN